MFGRVCFGPSGFLQKILPNLQFRPFDPLRWALKTTEVAVKAFEGSGEGSGAEAGREADCLEYINATDSTMIFADLQMSRCFSIKLTYQGFQRGAVWRFLST